MSIRKVYTESITVSGGSISVNGNRVVVNGEMVKDFNEVEEKTIYVIVNGNPGTLSVDRAYKVEVNGDVGTLKTMSGDVEVKGYVKCGVTTMSGDIRCGYITGDVKTTSGDIACGDIGGGVRTISGDINHR